MEIPDPRATRAEVWRVSPGAQPRARQTVFLNMSEPSEILAFLVVTTGDYRGSILRLNPEVTRIGRDGPHNDHLLDDDAVSGRHMSIRHDAGRFSLTDLDSANGTRVNGHTVHRCALRDRDTITVGQTNLVFVHVTDVSSGDMAATHPDPPTSVAEPFRE